MNFFKKHRQLLSVLGLVSVAALFAAGCSNSSSNRSSLTKSTLQSIKKKGTVTIGMVSGNVPYEYQTVKNGKTVVEGSDVQLVKKIAKKLGVKYTLKTMDLDGLLPAAQANKVDMLVTTLAPTPERKKAVKFSDIYYKSTNALVVRKEDASKYKKSVAFKKATIAVVNNSTQDAMLKKVFPNAKLKLLSKVADLALAVKNNKADAFCVDVPNATMLLRQNKTLTMTSWRHEDTTLGAAVAFPKNTTSDLVKVVNQVIKENKTNYAQWVNYYAKNSDVN